MLQHVMKGCLSDDSPPTYIGADGKQYKKTATSQVEAVHHVIADRLAASHMHPRSANFLLATLLQGFSVRNRLQ